MGAVHVDMAMREVAGVDGRAWPALAIIMAVVRVVALRLAVLLDGDDRSGGIGQGCPLALAPDRITIEA